MEIKNSENFENIEIANKKLFDTLKPKKYKPKNWLMWVAAVFITLIITVPTFIVAYKYFPEIKVVIDNQYSFRLEYIILFSIIFILFFFLIRLIKNIIFGIALMMLIVLTINTFRKSYGFKEVYYDYKSMIVYLIEEPVKVPFLPESAAFRNAAKIRKAITYNDPKVRNFAIISSLKNFNDKYLYRRYGNAIRYFSIFKEIKSKWQYVPDPKLEEYYAPATETYYHLSGDCDDYSIFMASCILAVGGEVRLVRTIGHIYPEVKISSIQDFEDYNMLIRELFPNETEGKSIYFHRDQNGDVWLNFDYTDKYPGGKFMDTKIVDILELVNEND
jgi:Ca2+/Na+ antiporter